MEKSATSNTDFAGTDGSPYITSGTAWQPSPTFIHTKLTYVSILKIAGFCIWNVVGIRIVNWLILAEFGIGKA